MMDEGSRKKKKKRGNSLNLYKVFGKAGSDDDSSSRDGGKALASDDTLVYCDVDSTHGTLASDSKKSSSSRGRMSRIFKAVLFDSVMKKKKKKKKKMRSQSSRPSFESSVGSSYAPDEERLDKSISQINWDGLLKDSDPDDYNSNVVKTSDPDDSNSIVVKTSDLDDSSSNDPSSQVSLSTKTEASPVASPINTTQNLTERKVTSRVDSMDKKPPLPPIPRPSVDKKPVVSARDSKTADLNKPNKPKRRLWLLILLSLVLTVILWMIYEAIAAANNEDEYTDVVIAGDEL